jgi:radical SAM superfamily enzyme YgiQ (UPF0313 family)
MNVLLVYPEMPDTLYAMRHFIRVVGKKAAYPPLGLLTVASLLPEGWSRRLVDLNLTSLKNEDLKWADYVFLSAMNVQEKSVMEIVKQCNRAGVKIVAGGSLFTHEYDRFDNIDHFVLNEAEITLPMFIDDLQQGNPKQVYKTNEFADISLSPLPAFDLADMDAYLYSIVQYSRGCPYMCDFCDVTTLLGRTPRTKDSDQIIRELEALARKNNTTRLVLFADDNLIGNKRVLKNELLPALIRWRKKNNPGFFFATQLSIDLADDDELMKLLLDAGFRHVFVGIETPDEAGLEGSGKKQNLKRDQLAAVKKLHEKGFIVSGGFIVGFDTDTPEIFHQQAAFIQESGIPLPIVNILKAPPGSELFGRLKKEGRLKKRFAFTEGETNIIPVMGGQALNDGFVGLINSIYRPDQSYSRMIWFFTSYKFPETSMKVPENYGVKDAIMVLRILLFLGVKDRYRKIFWKLLWWSLVNNRKFLDKALFYGITIYQMHQTSLTLEHSIRSQNRQADDNRM